MKIGLVGRMRSGKDTVAEMIADELGSGRTAIVGFADNVRWVAELTGKPGERKDLQAIGEKMREVSPTFWIDALFYDLTGFDEEHVVVKDVRHVNEAAALRAAGYHIVRVHAYDLDRFVRSGLDHLEWLSVAEHSTETESALIVGDYTIMNTADKVYLQQQTRSALREIRRFEREAIQGNLPPAATGRSACGCNEQRGCGSNGGGSAGERGDTCCKC